jgi:hypothetical protein
MGGDVNTANTQQLEALDGPTYGDAPIRHAVRGNHPAVLTDVYEETANIVIWQRQLTDGLKQEVHDFVAGRQRPYLSMLVTPKEAPMALSKALGGSSFIQLREDICELLDMFCCLFELKRAGLRLTVLNKTMCPKFHVDHVPARMITTYQGVATEWLPQQQVDRSKLGVGSGGKSDEESGIYQHPSHIQTLSCGEVALLKGEAWLGNQNAGLVHRSPALPNREPRLLLTLDFSN